MLYNYRVVKVPTLIFYVTTFAVKVNELEAGNKPYDH